MHPHEHVRSKEQREAEHHVRRSGYKAGGRIESDEKQDARVVTKGVHEHEKHLHKGEPETDLHLKGGGKVKGDAPRHRADKMARGGKVKGGPSKVNIVIATGGGEGERQMAFKQGLQTGATVGAAQSKPPMMPPPGARPPMAPPPGMPPGAGGPPGGPMPPGAAMTGGLPGTMPPRPPMKRGGKVVEWGGAGGGEGRLEKAGMENEIKVREHTRRRSGGRI